MNVLFINSCFYGGGAEKVTRQLYYGFKSGNFKSYLCIGTNDGKYNLPKDENIFTLYPKGIMEENLNKYYQIAKNNYLINLYSVAKIIYIIKRYHVDIVHINNIHSKYLGIYDIFIISKVCPVVLTMHDMWTFTGHCAYSGDCKEWVSGCGKCKKLYTYPNLTKDTCSKNFRNKKFAFTHSNIKFVTPSKWLLKLSKKSLLKREQIQIINNGVNTKKFRYLDKKELRSKYKLPEDQKYILFLSASLDDKRKGLSHVIAALSKLADIGNYTILVAGKKLTSKKISNQLKVIEFGYIVEEEKLNEIYALADIFIIPSLEDNFPCVTLESMASGTPVVAFDTGGLNEQVDSETGYIVKNKTPEGLAEAIEEMFVDKEKLNAMSQSCRKKVEKLYDEDIMLNKYKELYKKTIK